MKRIIIIILQCIIMFGLIAMDDHIDRNRAIQIVRLKQRINEKERQIQRDTIIRYTVEFSTPFLASSIHQPYAAGVMAVGVAAICFLTNDIENAVEVRDYLIQLIPR